MEPIMVAILIGIGAGITRSVLGFLNQGEAGESFNKYKLGKSTIRTCLASIMFTITLVNGDIDVENGVMIFFVAVGADVAWKEAYNIGNVAVKG